MNQPIYPGFGTEKISGETKAGVAPKRFSIVGELTGMPTQAAHRFPQQPAKGKSQARGQGREGL